MTASHRSKSSESSETAPATYRNDRLIRHHPSGILEDAAFEQGVAPHQLYRLLFPVWRVEISATTEDEAPYDVVDRFVERGIAEAALRTPSELAAFLGVDEALVHRTLRFLTRIGHVVSADEGLALTDLGWRSVRAGVRYTYTMEDRRKLYFDAAGSRPLTRPYYDRKAVRFLSEFEAVQAAEARPVFSPLPTPKGFRREALGELANQHDRKLFNLPRGLYDPRWLGEERVYLPMYVVRGTDDTGTTRYLAYTQANDQSPSASPSSTAVTAVAPAAYLTELCRQTPDLLATLDYEHAQRRLDLDEQKLQAALRKKAPGHEPIALDLDDGLVGVTYSPSAFADGDESAKLLGQVGGYVPHGDTIVRTWCPDEAVRQRALLTRAGRFLQDWTDPGVGRAWLGRTASLLELEDGTPETLLRLARDRGDKDLARLLSKLC